MIMKKEYNKPKAIMVDYKYDSNVVASSVTCSGSHYVFQTPFGCNKYKYTDYPKTATISSLHPCDWVVEGEVFGKP